MRYIALVSDADRNATETALAAIGRPGLLVHPVILHADPDNLDANGVFTGTPRAWMCDARLDDVTHEYQSVSGVIGSVAVDSISFNDQGTRKPYQSLGALASANGYRCPGCDSVVMATILSDGSEPAQAVGTDWTVVTQWTGGRGVINSDYSDPLKQRVILPIGGEYQGDVEIGTTGGDHEFSVSIAGQMGQVMTPVSDRVNTLLLANLPDNVWLEMMVRSATSAPLKFLAGSFIHLERLSA